MSYTSTQAFCAGGTTIQYASAGHSASPTYDKTLGEVTSVKQDGEKVATEDATNMQSLQGYKEFIPGMIDPGSYSFDFNCLPNDSGQAGLLPLAQSRKLTDWKVVLPPASGFVTSAGSYTFIGMVEEYGPFNFPPDKKATGACKIKVSGPITFAAGS